MLKKALAIVSGFVALFSAIFVFAAIGDIASGGDGETSMGVLIGLLVFFGGATAGAGFLATRLWRGSPFQPEAYESLLLELARRHGGRVTIPEVAMELGLHIDDATEALDHLVANGVADTLVSDSGALVFSVPGLLSEAEKQDARGVMDP